MKNCSNSILSISPHSKLMRRMLVLLCFISMFSYSGYSATYYSRVATGNFATAGTWSVNRSGTPTNPTALAAGDIFFILNGHSITLAANQTANQITIESGGSLAPNNTRTLTLTNPLIIENGGTLSLTTRTLTFGASSLENSGSITGSTGEISRTTGTFTNTATGIVNMTGGAAYVMGTGNFVNENTSANVNFGTGSLTVSGTGANQFIGGFTISGRFTVSKTAGSTTLTGDVNSGGITKSGGSTLDMGSGTHTSTNTVILTAGIMNGGSSTINANFAGAGAWQGTGTVFVPQTSTVNFGAAVNQSLTASAPQTFYNLTFSNIGIKTNTGVTVNNIFSLEGTATASAAPTYGPSATLRYNTATSRTVGAEWLATFTATGGVIIDNTGAITTNGNKVFDLDVPLTINTGATLSPAPGDTFSFGGDLINSGTWTASTGAVDITLARTSQSIGSFETSGLVTMSKTSGTATFTGNINGGAFTMNGAGTLNLGTGLNHTFTGDWTNTTGTLEGNTSTLNIGGTGSGTGVTFTAGTSTVNFNGGLAQNIPAFTYYILNTATGGTKTLLGSTTVSNVLTVGPSSTFATGAFTLTLSGTGTPLVDNGTFTATAGGTVIYSGATANIAAESYANLHTSTAGVKTLAGNTTVATVLTVNSPSTLETGAFTLTLSGTGTPLVDNGTFTASSGSTVIFSGATATIAGETYVNLQASTAGAKTLGANTIASGVVTINSGSTLALSTFTLTLSGTGTPLVNSGGNFTASTGTVIYSGATATVAALTYHNLQTSTAGSKTLGGTTAVNNILTINSPSTLDLSSFTISLPFTGTPLVNNGTIAGTGTVNFSGSGAQTVAATTYPNLEFSGAGTKTISAGATVTVTSNWVVGSPTTMTTTAIADVGGNISGSGSITMGSGTINIAGNWTNNGTLTGGTGTVIYDGTTQSIGGVSYYNLQTSNSGVKTLGGGTTVANILTIGASTTLDLSSVTLTLSAAGTPLVNSGTFTCSTSTVSFSSASSTNVPALNYYNLTLTGGARVFAASGEIGIANTFTPGAGGFTVTGSTVNFNGSVAQTIPAFTFNDLVLSGSGTKTILTATSVTVNQININDGPTLDLPGTSVINIIKP